MLKEKEELKEFFYGLDYSDAKPLSLVQIITPTHEHCYEFESLNEDDEVKGINPYE